MMETLERHELSAAWGDMGGTDNDELLKSITEIGIINPKVTIFEGKVLDGWHRYQASVATGRSVDVEEFTGDYTEAVNFVIAQNGMRRQLPAEQRAAIVEVLRQDERYSMPARAFDAKVAKEAGVSERTVRRVKNLPKEELDAVAKGDKTAWAIHKEKKAEAEAAEQAQTSILDHPAIEEAYDYDTPHGEEGESPVQHDVASELQDVPVDDGTPVPQSDGESPVQHDVASELQDVPVDDGTDVPHDDGDIASEPNAHIDDGTGTEDNIRAELCRVWGDIADACEEPLITEFMDVPNREDWDDAYLIDEDGNLTEQFDAASSLLAKINTAAWRIKDAQEILAGVEAKERIKAAKF